MHRLMLMIHKICVTLHAKIAHGSERQRVTNSLRLVECMGISKSVLNMKNHNPANCETFSGDHQPFLWLSWKRIQ